MKFFKIDKKRDRVASDVAFYKCDLSPVVNKAIALGNSMPFEAAELPSWTKVAADPNLAAGFLVPMAEAMFAGRHNLKSVNTNLAWSKPKLRVCEMFVPGNIRCENLEQWATIMQNTLGGWRVIPLYGDAKDAVGNRGMNGKSVEKDVKEHILSARNDGVKSIMFISAILGTRSFSVPEITELYLAYDNGDAGATIQKMSRVLTSDDTTTKIGRIISLSFDPNRDDKFDPWIVTTALNLARRDQIPVQQALRQVLDTLDIFSMTGKLIKLDADQYHEEMLDRNGFGKIMGATSDLTALDSADLNLLASLDITKSGAKQSVTQKGKKYADKAGNKKGPKGKAAAMREKKVKEALKFIAEYLDVFMLGTNSKSVNEMVHQLIHTDEYRKDFESQFHISVELIERLFKTGALNKSLLELHVNA